MGVAVGDVSKPGVPRWLLVTTAGLGLVAAVLVVVVRYYEIQKARAEAARALAELKNSSPEPDDPPKGRPTAGPRPAGAKSPTIPPAPASQSDKGAPAPAAEPSPAARELAAFAGDWRCVREEQFGKVLGDDETAARSRRLRVTSSQLLMTRVINNAFGRYEGELTVDPDPRPKGFVFVGRDPGGNPVRWTGIYALTGDDLKLGYVYQEPGRMRPRPTEFASPLGSLIILLDFHRVR